MNASTILQAKRKLPVIVRRLLAVAFLGLVCVGAFWVGLNTSNPTINGGLRIPPDKLHFGEVWQNLDFPWTMPMENPTAKTIEIEKFVSSCHCLSIEPESLILSPGQSANLRLRLDITRYLKGSGQVQAFSAHVVPILKANLQQQEGWTIEGQVKKSLWLTDRVLHFSEGLIEGENHPKRALTIDCHVTVREINALTDTNLLIAEVRKEKPGSFRLEVSPHSFAPPGCFSAHIKLQTLLEDGYRAEADWAIATGTISRPIAFAPEILLLGFRRLGETVNEVVTLRSLRNQPFFIDEINVSSSSIFVEKAISNPPACSVALSIRQKINHEGEQKGKVSVVVRVPSADDRMTIVLPVTYHGQAKNTVAISHPLQQKELP